MKIKFFTCAVLTLIPWIFSASCGSESAHNRSSELQQLAVAANSSALQAYSEILDGIDLQIVLAKYSLNAAASAAAWDYYKAQQGIDIVQGQKIPALGEKRRFWIRAAETHSKEIRAATIDKALVNNVHIKVERLYIKSFREARGVAYSAPVFNYLTDLNQQEIDKINAVLALIPEKQREVLDPIFLIDHFPGDRDEGGGYFNIGSEVDSWLGKGAKTGVPDQDILDFVKNSGRGLIGISRKALLKKGIYPYTILHESAHSIHNSIGIEGTKDSAQYSGVHYGGKAVNIHELAAEAYSRYLFNKTQICTAKKDNETKKYIYIPEGEDMKTCTARVFEKAMKEAPVFKFK